MTAWDRELLLWINGHQHPLLDAILYPIASAGESGLLWALVLLALFGGRPLRRWKTTLVAGLLLLAVAWTCFFLLTLVFFRERPYLVLDRIRQLGIRWETSSFPSGHANSATLATVALGMRRPRLLYVLLPFLLFTLYSRPYLGMHYPSDVLAGTLFGALTGWIVGTIERRQKRAFLLAGGAVSPRDDEQAVTGRGTH